MTSKHVWLATFTYNCTRGQLNNKGGGKLHERKRSPDKTEIGKGIIWYRVHKHLLKSRAHHIVLGHEK